MAGTGAVLAGREVRHFARAFLRVTFITSATAMKPSRKSHGEDSHELSL